MDFSIVDRVPSIVKYVNVENLNVRNNSNVEAERIDGLTQFRRVEILEEYTNSWVRIKYGNNQFGYVYGPYLTSTPPPLEIISLRVGNTDSNNNWLTNAGNALYSSQMRYLKPVITYNSTITGSVTFFVKIIQPNGVIFRNSSVSPSGYSYSHTVQITRGNNQTLNLSGWGNSTSSSYHAGEWTIEVWYDNKRLRSEKINIRP